MKNSVNNKKPFNNEPLRDGEVLVPMMTDRGTAISYGADPANIYTWTTAGVPYKVIYIPVPADQETIAWKTFYAELNDLLNERLGANRYARCLIPQEDGSMKVCPKANRCTGCPDKGIYESENRTQLSIERLMEDEYSPTLPSVPSAESEALEILILDDLFKELDKLNPHYGNIVRLGMQGLAKKEIIEKLPMKKSQAYQLVSDCEKYVRQFLKK